MAGFSDPLCFNYFVQEVNQSSSMKNGPLIQVLKNEDLWVSYRKYV